MASLVLPLAAKKVLDKEDGPLVWIDCEMTGLDLATDRLLEIAVVITNGELEAVDRGIEFVIRTDKAVLDAMGEWCVDMHGKTGLTQACLDSPHSLAEVEAAVLAYIKERIPSRSTGILAGNTVHADLAFLKLEEGRGMRSVVDWLHYRIVDVSSIKELSTRWFPNVAKTLREDRLRAQAAAAAATEAGAEGQASFTAHRAMDDIVQSILELKDYRQHLFRQSDVAKRTKRERADDRDEKEREGKRLAATATASASGEEVVAAAAAAAGGDDQPAVASSAEGGGVPVAVVLDEPSTEADSTLN